MRSGKGAKGKSEQNGNGEDRKSENNAAIVMVME